MTAPNDAYALTTRILHREREPNERHPNAEKKD